jgi:predicted alpha/beta hydrolase family esterase
MAGDWGAAITEIGPRGHINGESGLGDWPEGLALLRGLAGAAR